MPGPYFGTDGIRGRANKQLSAQLALKVGQAVGIFLRRRRRGNHQYKILVGKDPRRSGYMIEQALTAGFLSAGMHVLLTGPIPTPAVAALTVSMRADLGVMISASHNPYWDNGIKLFGPSGFKLSSEEQREIEALIDSDLSSELPQDAELGKAERIDGAQDRYIVLARRVVPQNLNFEGLRIVIDCAHGASYKVAPKAFAELGAEVYAIGIDPNGININHECGSTAPQALMKEVLGRRADIGIAFDGDADRLVVVDETGQLVDGDQCLALIARHWHTNGILLERGVVGTTMSNSGLKRFLKELGIPFFRSDVGDRYVLEEMRKQKARLGGEQSGHIIMSDYATTGDGLVAALLISSILKECVQSDPSCTLSKLAHCFEPLPQILRNLHAPKELLETSSVVEAVKTAEAKLGADGRLVVRPSGTEPVIRLMAEGSDKSTVIGVLDELEIAIAKALR